MADIKRNIEIEANTGAAQDAIGALADTLAGMTKASDEGGDAMKRAARATAEATAKMGAAREAAQKEARALSEAAAAATAHGKDSKEAAAAVAKLKAAQDDAAKAHNDAAQAAAKAASEISELAKTADKKAVAGLKRLSDQLVKVSKDADRNASDLRTLEHRITSLGDEANKAGGFLEKFKNGAIMGLGASVAQAGLGALVDGVKAAGMFAVETAANYERLKTALETTTGSQAAANEQFERLQRFAAATPFSLEEVTDGYIKLSNRGINANDRLLTSLGNTASAMGKTLDDAVEAMADAITGENERLKEFGIVGKKSGDTIAYTFRGVTTVVKNDAAAISEYLVKLGETNFAGGMEKQSRTLAGLWSTLQDTAAQFADTMMNSGVSDVLREIMVEMTGAAAEGKSLAQTLGGSLAEGLKATYNLAKALIPILEGTARAFNWLFESVNSVNDPLLEAAARVETIGREAEVAEARLAAYGRAHGDALGPLGEMVKATFLGTEAQENYNAAVREGIRAREDQARTEAALAALTTRRAQEDAARLAKLQGEKDSRDKAAKMAEYESLKGDKSLTPEQKKRLRELTKDLNVEDTSAEERARKAAAKRAAQQQRKGEKLEEKQHDFTTDIDAFEFEVTKETRKAHSEAEAAAFEQERAIREARVTSIELEIEAINARGVADAEHIDAIFFTLDVESEAAAARQALIDERISEEERLARWETKNAKTAEQREKARTRLEQVEQAKRLNEQQKATAAEAKEHAKRAKVVEVVTGTVTTLAEGMAGAIQRAAEGEKGAIASMLQDLLKATATKHALLSLAEFALAAGSAASFNIPGAVAHATAGGLHAAVAVAAGVGAFAAGKVADARAAAPSGGGSGGGGGPPFGRSGNGSTGGAGVGGGTSPGGRDGGLEAQVIPVSHEQMRRSDASARSGSGGHTVIVQGGTFVGVGGMRQVVDMIEKELDRRSHRGPRPKN